MPAKRDRAADLLCAAFLALDLWCAVGQWSVGALRPGDLPAQGPVTVAERRYATPAEARFGVQATRPGTLVRVADTRGERTVPVVPLYPPIHHLIGFVIGLAFWATCVFAFAGRARSEPGRSFFWVTLLYGLAIASGDVHFPAPPLVPNLFRPLLRMASILVTPLLFLRIATIFPQPDRRLARSGFLPALTLLVVIVFGFEGAAFVRLAAAPTSEAFAHFALWRRLADVFFVLMVVVGFLQLSRNTARAELTRERQQAKWVWWGVIIGPLPFVLFHQLPRALGLEPVLPLAIARLFAVAVPIAFAIAIVQHQFLNIDVIIRRSLIYGAMAGLLTTVYLVVGVALGGVLEAQRPLGPHAADALRLVGAATAIALYDPTRKFLGAWVDRTFFKMRTDYSRAARALRHRIVAASLPQAVCEESLNFVRATLAPNAAGVIARSGNGLVVRGDLWSALDVHEQEAILAALPAGGETIAVPDRTSRPEIERADFPPALRNQGAVLLQPLIGEGGAVGAIALGEKATERRYIEEDLALLETVGGESGHAITQLNLIRAAAEEHLLREQREQVARKKAEFLSQVAHDLRTPLTSILWSSRNLLDGVAGPLPDDARTYVDSIQSAAGHLNRLVHNLLEIARLEGDGPPLVLAPVSASAVAREAILTLTPIAKERGIELALVAPASVPDVVAQREGLMKALLNLIENALKFAPRGSRVEIAVVRLPGGWQTVSVLDHGPGVPARERERIFEPYHQGRTPGEGAQGLGLGLTVVRAYIERFGGEVTVQDAPGGGAAFVCRLVESPGDRKESIAWPAS